MNNPMDPHEIGGAPFHSLPSSSQVLQSLLAAGSSPSFDEPSMVDFGGIRRRRRRSEAEPDDGEADEEEEEEEELGRRRSEKKRRLSATQVQYLEKSFEVENKLEPERKNQLAKELNLQPRQVAIWFQNRRARFKTKQLEKDYGVLKSSFDSLKSHYDDLLMEKDQLQNEVSLLKAKLKLKETSNSDSSIQTEAPLALVKQEEASSVKSDVVDSESPNSTSPEGSDFSQEDLAGSFMPVAADDYGFGKVEEGDFQGGSCSGFGVPGLEGHPSYWPWLY